MASALCTCSPPLAAIAVSRLAPSCTRPRCLTLLLYFITESGPPGQGAEWYRVRALEPVREVRISSADLLCVCGLLLNFSVPWFPRVVCEEGTANTSGALRSLHATPCSVAAPLVSTGPFTPPMFVHGLPLLGLQSLPSAGELNSP